MRREELEFAAEMAEQAAEAVELILTQGIAQAMNRFNRRASTAEEQS
jgi:hypothetical protein